MSIEEQLQKDICHLECPSLNTEQNIISCQNESSKMKKERIIHSSCSEKGDNCKQNELPPLVFTEGTIIVNNNNNNLPENEKGIECNEKKEKLTQQVSKKESNNRVNQLDVVANKIKDVYENGWTSLDLHKKQLVELPQSMFTSNNIMYLYLANNKISVLPDGFFENFPSLRWLDLRHNCLTDLPNIGSNGHDELRCLLIEGNSIRKLPLQLGFMRKLHGLNIYNNPIEFPPSHIIKKGTREILKYLFDYYFEQKKANDSKLSEECSNRDEVLMETSDQKQEKNSAKQLNKTKKMKDSKKNKQSKVNHEKAFDKISQKSKEDLLKSTLQKNNIKIEKKLQHKKDRINLKKFQDQYRQQQKYNASLTHEFSSEISSAPFGTDLNCKKKSPLTIQENRQPLPDIITRKTKSSLGKARTMKIEELETKIKNHYIKMHERRKQFPNSVADKVTDMKKDLDEAKYLQEELEGHRQDLEYRFKAFTADVSIAGIPNAKRNE